MPTEAINLDDLDLEDTESESSIEEESAIIRCGRILSRKARETNADKLLSGKCSSETGLVVEDITREQKDYINLVATGTQSTCACQMLGIDVFLPVLWEETADKDGTFMQCMTILKRKQADLLEENVWDQAMNNPKSTILKMFALKARKDEYKDNALPMTAVQTNIHVTLDGVPYSVNATIKDVEVDTNG
jgi:hypothetical protein